eukprot:4372315-Karenia_brevis.AAC.1
MITATAVPHKGGRGGFAVDKCLEFIDETGDHSSDILIKSDTDESMILLIRMSKEDRVKGRTVVEEAPKGVKGSNGIVERAVQEIEGHMRAFFIK